MARGGHNRIDLTGQRFGRLVVLSYGETRGKVAYWRCACECGVEKLIAGTSLKSGHSTSCGCVRREIVAEKNHKHGFARRWLKGRWYIIWNGMMARCHSEKHPDYPQYGGRGVVVCEEWRDAANFIAWCEAHEPVPLDLSIDRYPDGDGPYAPNNCRFATDGEQVRNRSMSIWVDINGERLVLKDAVAKYGVVSYSCAKVRVREFGWKPIDAVLLEPHSVIRRDA
jgi:hypothetical protein